MLRCENGTLKSGLEARSLCDGGSITRRLRPPQSEVQLQFCDNQPLLTRCGARMPLTPLNECSSAVMRSNAHNAPWRYQLVLPAKKGAQGMIVKHKLPYAIKKERDGAGDITLGLHPAARR